MIRRARQLAAEAALGIGVAAGIAAVLVVLACAGTHAKLKGHVDPWS